MPKAPCPTLFLLHNASLNFASEYLQDPELDDARTDYDA